MINNHFTEFMICKFVIKEQIKILFLLSTFILFIFMNVMLLIKISSLLIKWFNLMHLYSWADKKKVLKLSDLLCVLNVVVCLYFWRCSAEIGFFVALPDQLKNKFYYFTTFYFKIYRNIRPDIKSRHIFLSFSLHTFSRSYSVHFYEAKVVEI